MILTVSRVESAIESRLGGFLSQVREITGDPNKPSIIECASRTARKLGYSVSSVLDITDDELEAVTSADVDVFLDLCELCTLKSMAGNLPAVDVTVGPESIKLSALSSTLEGIIRRRSAEIESEWGSRIPGVGSMRRRARIIIP